MNADELFQADQLQQRQKGANDLRPAGSALKQVGKAHTAAPGNHLEDELDFFADGPFVLENLPGVVAFLKPPEDGIDGVEQVEDGNVRFGRRRGAFKFQFAGQARKDIFLPGFQRLQLRRRRP